MESCPYCGEDQRALKNHVRLSSDNGHGASGEYPEDFQNENADQDTVDDDQPDSLEEPEEPRDSADKEADSESEPPGGTVELTRQETNDTVGATATTAANSHEPAQDRAQEQPTTTTKTTTESRRNAADNCPECGQSLAYGFADELFFATNGRVVTLEKDDGYCKPCDVVVGGDGAAVYGSESSQSDTLPSCTECGEDTVAAEHAYAMLEQQKRRKSRLRVRSRGKLKKMQQRLAKINPNYVCRNCRKTFF